MRTEIIRKTVNVYRREHPHHAAGTGPAVREPSGTGAPPARSRGASAAASVATRTRSSGARAVAPASVRDARREHPQQRLESEPSGSSSGRQLGLADSENPQQRDELLGGGSGSSRPVSTRSSGGGEGHGGGHDD